MVRKPVLPSTTVALIVRGRCRTPTVLKPLAVLSHGTEIPSRHLAAIRVIAPRVAPAGRTVGSVSAGMPDFIPLPRMLAALLAKGGRQPLHARLAEARDRYPFLSNRSREPRSPLLLPGPFPLALRERSDARAFPPVCPFVSLGSRKLLPTLPRDGAPPITRILRVPPRSRDGIARDAQFDAIAPRKDFEWPRKELVSALPLHKF